tara:strand:+ start:367 stop:759 length:393 start_codon:yes stop_codon:yes gene_type:complete
VSVGIIDEHSSGEDFESEDTIVNIIHEHDFIESYLEKITEFKDYAKSLFWQLVQNKYLYTFDESSRIFLTNFASDQASNGTENDISALPTTLNICGSMQVDDKTKSIYDLILSEIAFENRVSPRINNAKN